MHLYRGRQREACVIFRLSAGRGFHENAAISKLPSRNYEYRGSYITAIISRTNGNLSARPDTELRYLPSATPRHRVISPLIHYPVSAGNFRLYPARETFIPRVCAKILSILAPSLYARFVFKLQHVAHGVEVQLRPTRLFVSVHFSKGASRTIKTLNRTTLNQHITCVFVFVF